MSQTRDEKAPARASNAAPGSNQERPNPTAAGRNGKAHFDREQLDAMRQRLPEYLTARGVELRPQGARLVGRCPAHDDSSPSFALFGARHETAGCYPCGFTGDVFAVSQWLGRASTFPEAVADVAAVLGYSLPQGQAQSSPPATQPQPRPAKQPEPPFQLSESDREKIHAARRAFCDAFHAGEPIVDEIAASLGLTRETLRVAAWGESGLGLANGWLCYCYPQGLKWRNPHPKTTPRFRFIVGKATAPWRMEWASKPEVGTVYLTEGESDTLALIESGIEADGTAACVASLGTSFPQAWAPLFAGKKVVLCLDRDTAGQDATARVAGILKGHAAEILAWKGPRQ